MLTPPPPFVARNWVWQERHRKNSVTPRDGGDVRDGGWAGCTGMHGEGECNGGY
jgi:hypothetical protein